jgi:EAL domain-containing protein (putative c-di-GMP-specific phosphodiesterase class I)
MVTPVDDLAVVKLLVLDDDPAVGETMALMAKRLQVECRYTNSADGFFRSIREWEPTHIALDLAMPEFDGIEALRRLAELKCEATVILVSGVDSRVLDAAHRAAQNHGLNVAGTIAKPFSMAVLRDFLTLERDSADLVPFVGIEPPKVPRLSKPMLAKAIAAGDIDVVFQPKVRASDSALIGFEALARWTHPKHGAIPPDRFIPLAERTGLCGPLTDIVFNIALGWLSQMQRPDLTLALNLSATSLTDIELADRIAGLCDKHGVDVSRVIIEITESSSIYDQTAALDLLVRLRLKGFSLSIDDFGVGYSSLSQLARIPFSELKIDRSFITTTPHSHESRTIVKAIVGLARNLGLMTVAEGVEDLATFGFLREIGCDQVQGYLISRPMNREAITAWMGPVPVPRGNGGGSAEMRTQSAVA